MLNPENPGGYVTMVSGKYESYQEVHRSLAVWEGPRRTQEQFSRRLYEIISKVEPAYAKSVEFLGLFTKEEVVAFTIGLAPAESGCLKPWGVTTTTTTTFTREGPAGFHQLRQITPRGATHPGDNPAIPLHPASVNLGSLDGSCLTIGVACDKTSAEGKEIRTQV
jgi:hypothetical protein